MSMQQPTEAERADMERGRYAGKAWVRNDPLFDRKWLREFWVDVLRAKSDFVLPAKLFPYGNEFSVNEVIGCAAYRDFHILRDEDRQKHHKTAATFWQEVRNVVPIEQADLENDSFVGGFVQGAIERQD